MYKLQKKTLEKVINLEESDKKVKMLQNLNIQYIMKNNKNIKNKSTNIVKLTKKLQTVEKDERNIKKGFHFDPE